MPKYLKLEALHEKCREARLNPEVNKGQLIERLEKDERQQRESSPENEDDPKCHAALATEAKIGSGEETKLYVKGALGKALEHGPLEPEYVMGDTVVGNRRGLDLAPMKHRLAVAEGKIAVPGNKIISLEAEASQPNDRAAKMNNAMVRMNDSLSTSTLAVKEYTHVRERFISTYKRDKLQKARTLDHVVIPESNLSAPGGSAAADAMLYDRPGARIDSVVFTKLYGMGPGEAVFPTCVPKRPVRPSLA